MLTVQPTKRLNLETERQEIIHIRVWVFFIDGHLGLSIFGVDSIMWVAEDYLNGGDALFYQSEGAGYKQ